MFFEIISRMGSQPFGKRPPSPRSSKHSRSNRNVAGTSEPVGRDAYSKSRTATPCGQSAGCLAESVACDDEAAAPRLQAPFVTSAAEPLRLPRMHNRHPKYELRPHNGVCQTPGQEFNQNDDAFLAYDSLTLYL